METVFFVEALVLGVKVQAVSWAARFYRPIYRVSAGKTNEPKIVQKGTR